MTNEEALDIMCKRCENHEVCMGTGCTPKSTIEKVIEKQIPKKPKTERKTVDLGNGYSVKIIDIHKCPECGKTIMKGYRCYGLDCGQKIDWGDYE